jgi:hypothetical protein
MKFFADAGCGKESVTRNDERERYGKTFVSTCKSLNRKLNTGRNQTNDLMIWMSIRR